MRHFDIYFTVVSRRQVAAVYEVAMAAACQRAPARRVTTLFLSSLPIPSGDLGNISLSQADITPVISMRDPSPLPHLWDDKLPRDQQRPQQVVSAVIPHFVDGHLRKEHTPL